MTLTKPPGQEGLENDGTADERTPLIPAPTPSEIPQANGNANGKPNGVAPDVENAPAQEEDVPLPKLQIFLLCYARIIEPIAFFSIFPFINQMIFETGDIKQTDVGFWSGLIVHFLTRLKRCVNPDTLNRNHCFRSLKCS